MENHLGELWALVDFLQPGLLGEEREFQRQYRTAIEKNQDKERAQALSRRIAPFVLRRTKDAVAPDLPEKTQIIETIALDEKQRANPLAYQLLIGLLEHPSLPVRNIKEFIALARKNPGALDYGSAGVGNTTHLGMELLQSMAKVKLHHLAFAQKRAHHQALGFRLEPHQVADQKVSRAILQPGPAHPDQTSARPAPPN